MKRNPYLDFTINKTPENLHEINRCSEYFGVMLNNGNTFSQIIESSQASLGYQIDYYTVIMFFDMLSKGNAELLQNFILQDDLNILYKDNLNNVIVKPRLLTEVDFYCQQVYYDTAANNEASRNTSSNNDTSSNTSANDNTASNASSNTSSIDDSILQDNSTAIVIIAIIATFIISRIMAYYFKDKVKTPEDDSTENTKNLVDTVNTTANDTVLNSIHETLYIFKYYMYIPFFTAAIFTVHYLYYKFKK